jgi:hypothetical protein
MFGLLDKLSGGITIHDNTLTLGRQRRRWVDNIKMDLREIGWDCVYWIDVPYNRD